MARLCLCARVRGQVTVDSTKCSCRGGGVLSKFFFFLLFAIIFECDWPSAHKKAVLERHLSHPNSGGVTLAPTASAKLPDVDLYCYSINRNSH